MAGFPYIKLKGFLLLLCLHVSFDTNALSDTALTDKDTITAKAALPKTDPSFPYYFSPKRGLFIGGSTFVLAGAGLYLNYNQEEITPLHLDDLDPSQINPFDRPATGYHSHTAEVWSDVTGFGLGLAGVGSCYWMGKSNGQRATLGVMYAEAILINGGLNLIVKNVTDRKRPLLYNPNVSDEEKLEGGKDQLRSFYSGHTSTAFCSAVFIAETFSELYPESKAKPWIWGGALALAGTTGYLRIRAGKHYATDVLVGAGMGSFFGWLVPQLHKNKSEDATAAVGLELRPAWLFGTSGLSLTYKL